MSLVRQTKPANRVGENRKTTRPLDGPTRSAKRHGKISSLVGFPHPVEKSFGNKENENTRARKTHAAEPMAIVIPRFARNLKREKNKETVTRTRFV